MRSIDVAVRRCARFRRDVCSGSLADIRRARADVRSAPESGHQSHATQRQLWAKFRHVTTRRWRSPCNLTSFGLGTTAGSSNLSVPPKNLFPAMPCAYAACAQTSALATVAASRIENFIYIKRHHQKVERIAVITAHDWQHCRQSSMGH